MTPVRVPSWGPENARIMIVGEAPGAKEELERRPFVGAAGNLLRELLLKAGHDPDSIRYANLCKYRPPDNDLSAWFDRSGFPTNDWVLEGLAELKEEIEHVKPNLIVACGNWPLWAFGHAKWNKKDGRPTGIMDRRGYIFEATKLARGTKVLATLHPSYIVRGGYAEAPLVVLDLQAARREAAYPDIRRRERQLLLDPRGAERAEVFARLMDEGPFISFDIEYIGTRLLCVGFTTGTDWAATVRIRQPDDVDWCRTVLQSGRPLCAQNGISDCSVLEWHYGFDVVRHLKFDTMVAAYNLNIEYPKDLGFLGGLYTDLPYWKEDVDWDKIKKGEQSIDEVLLYNARDTVATHEIAVKQQAELNSDVAYKRAFDFDMSKLLPLWEVSRRGVRIDTDEMFLLSGALKKEIRDGIAKLRPLYGGDLNVKSGPAVGKFLFDMLGIPAGGTTPGGLRKTDDITLASCLVKCTNDNQRFAIKTIREIREARDLDSKFAEIELDDDDRARCHYDPTKTVTRRLSSRKFYPTGKGMNLQNVPVQDPRPRKVFIPDPGFEFAYSDLKGAEFMIVAVLTQDPEMLRLMRGSLDGSINVHKETAAFLFDCNPKEVTKESPRYFLGKRTRHSGNYMIGWKKFMDYVNAMGEETGVYITAAESKRLLTRYYDLHPMLRSWHNEVASELRRTHTLSNLFGFKRVFHDRADAILPEAVAFIPQSTIGDMLNMGLMNCWEDEELRRMDFQLLLQVHDAIGYQYPKDLRFEVNARVRQLLDVPVLVPKTGETLHVPVEINVGPTWGDCVEWSEDLKKEAA